MVDVAEAETKPNGAGHRRRRWPWFVAVGVVVLIAVGVTGGVWYARSHANLQPLAVYPLGGARVPVHAGHTLLFGDMVDEASVFSHPRDPGTLTLTIDSIRPVVRTNTSGATITVEECVLARTGHNLMGVSPAAARQQCSSLAPFHPGTVTLGYGKGDVDIVLAVRPAHAGLTDVHGVEVSFSAGSRHGSQHSGVQGKTTTH